MLTRLRQVGTSHVAAIDLAEAGLPFSVVRVVVPGLEGYPHNAGYVPGARARRRRR